MTRSAIHKTSSLDGNAPRAFRRTPYRISALAGGALAATLALAAPTHATQAQATQAQATQALATQAQIQEENLSEVFTSYDITTLSALLSSAGLTFRQSTTAAGDEYITISFGGLNHILQPAACVEGTCRGLRMVTAFREGAPDIATANRFNAAYWPSRIFTDGNAMFFHRYLIGDYGYTRGAFFVNLAVFAGTSAQFTNFSGPGPRSNSISFEPSVTPDLIITPSIQNAPPGVPMPGDDMANDLNARQKIGNVGVASRPAHNAARIQTSVRVSDLIEQAARNARDHTPGRVSIRDFNPDHLN